MNRIYDAQNDAHLEVPLYSSYNHPVHINILPFLSPGKQPIKLSFSVELGETFSALVFSPLKAQTFSFYVHSCTADIHLLVLSLCCSRVVASNLLNNLYKAAASLEK